MEEQFVAVVAILEIHARKGYEAAAQFTTSNADVIDGQLLTVLLGIFRDNQLITPDRRIHFLVEVTLHLLQLEALENGAFITGDILKDCS